MSELLHGIRGRDVPQTERADAREVRNSAGGYVFEVSDWERLRRFLIIGAGGTYYTNARTLTKENAEVVVKLANEDGERLVREIVAISAGGRAPKQDAGVFALAIAASYGSDESRKAALAALPVVCRTATTLFMFCSFIEQFRGWGRGLRTAVGKWYLNKPVDAVAYQAVKYRNRHDMTHRDLLRLSHPKTDETARRALFGWMVHPNEETLADADLPALVGAFEESRTADKARVLQILAENPSMTWEMLPDEMLNEREVWEQLLSSKDGRGVPIGALIRQLPRLTRLGLLTAASPWTAQVTERLTDTDALRKGRIHPVSVLIAQRTYEQGHSMRGSSTWTPTRKVIDALDAAFYKAFASVEPTGKRHLLALDVSGSMGSSISADIPISCREMTAAIALVIAATEPDTLIYGFSNTFTELPISPRQRLSDAIGVVSGLPFQSTDCALPFKVARAEKWPVDMFVVMTDSETWAGYGHPAQELRRYRTEVGVNARSAVLGMTATEVSIADPADPGMLDIVGMDTAVPTLLNEFARS